MVWVSLEVNPMPVADTGPTFGARNWIAMNSNGIMLASPGMTVPVDTQGQPVRPWNGGAPGSWVSPRWGWPGATTVGYQADVGQQHRVVDWTPGEPSGYALDNYGALWPFGPKAPIAATGLTGAPFGLYPLAGPLGQGVQYFCNFDMHSANGLPFGQGGVADGFGWMIGYDAQAIVHWFGPISLLSNPPATPGQNTVRDFQVNPNGAGGYYVLYDNGFIHAGSAVGGGGHDGIVTTPRSPGGWGPQPSGAAGVHSSGFPSYVWMHVQWDQGWIVAVDTDGNSWGYYLESNAFATGRPIPGGLALNGGGAYEGKGAIVPPRDPARYWLLSFSGAVTSVLDAGTVPGVGGQPAMTLGFVAGKGPTDTTRPTFTWNWSAQFSLSQKSYSIRVYPKTVTLLAGFVIGQNAGAIHLNDQDALVASGTAGTDRCSHDLRNGVEYVAYQRSTSTAGGQSTWISNDFTVGILPVVTVPSSCTAAPHPAAAYPPVALGKVTVTAGGGAPPGDQLFQYQYSANGAEWQDVTGFEATTATSIDHLIAPTSVPLRYRVRKFHRVPAKIAGPWATSGTITLTPQSGLPFSWCFVDPFTLGGTPNVVPLSILPDSFTVDRTEPHGETPTISAPFYHWDSTGEKGAVITLKVRTEDSTAYAALWNILGVGHALILLTAFGELYWVRGAPGSWAPLRAQPLSSESTGIRNAHITDLRMVETGPESA